MVTLAFQILVTALVGLGLPQTARVDLLYPPAAAQADTTVVAPSSCVTEVDFFDSNSNQVKTQQVSLMPGQEGSVTLTRSQLGAKQSNNHALFYVEASIVNNCGSNVNCDPTLCNIIPSAETVDSNGQTEVLINAALRLRAFAAPN
jgi:hypothetical protein